MDLKPLAVFLHDPSADSIQDGLETGEFSIGGVLPFIGAQVTACDIACATPCLTQSWSITFPGPYEFGTCNDCGISIAFNIRLRRQSNFDIEDYLHLTSDLGFTYEPDQVPSGQVLGATVSAYFIDFINNGAYDDEHDFFGITAVAGGVGEVILTVPCPIQVDVFQSQDSEPMVIAETVGQTASLTKAQLMKEYPLMIGYVPGQNVDDTFTQCEDICVIHISGCIPGCVADAQNLLTTNNAVHLHDVGTKFSYKLFVNSSGPGYADFIDELNAAVGVCSLDAIVGSQVPFVTDVAAASLDLTTIGADAGTEAFGTYTSAKGSITNGTLTVYFDVTGAPVNVSDIVGAINTATGSATPLTHAAGVITLAAPFDTGVVTIKVVTS